MQRLGAKLIEDDIYSFCEKVLSQTKWKPGEPLIIDGIRHIEVADTLSKIIKPSRLFLIYLEAAESIVKSRIGNEKFLNAKKVASHSTEIQVEKVLKHRCHLVIDSGDSLDRSEKKIIDYYNKIKNS